MIILNIFLLLDYLFFEISSNFLFCFKQCWKHLNKTAGYILLRVSKLRPSCQVTLCGLQATFANCVHSIKITQLFRLSGAPHSVISPNAACKWTHSRCGPLPKKGWISMAYIKHQNVLCLHETPQLECMLCLYVFQTTATWPDITLALSAWLRSENS